MILCFMISFPSDFPDVLEARSEDHKIMRNKIMGRTLGECGGDVAREEPAASAVPLTRQTAKSASSGIRPPCVFTA